MQWMNSLPRWCQDHMMHGCNTIHTSDGEGPCLLVWMVCAAWWLYTVTIFFVQLMSTRGWSTCAQNIHGTVRTTLIMYNITDSTRSHSLPNQGICFGRIWRADKPLPSHSAFHLSSPSSRHEGTIWFLRRKGKVEVGAGMGRYHLRSQSQLCRTCDTTPWPAGNETPVRVVIVSIDWPGPLWSHVTCAAPLW